MASSSRDRISVDLQGLKAALFDRAQALGVSPSGFVRTALADALEQPQGAKRCDDMPHRLLDDGNGLSAPARVRLCLRMSPHDARATVLAARCAGLSPGAYVGGLVAGVPVLLAGSRRADVVTALTASNAELATLGRNIHRLTALLRQADVEPARHYREMLDTLAADVRSHLELAARVLAELQPLKPGAETALRFHP